MEQVQVNRLWEAVRLTSREVVWELDPNGIITYVNDAATDVLGASPTELVGRSVFSVMYAGDSERTKEIFARSLQRKTGWHGVQLRTFKPDEGHPWIETSSVANVGPEDQVLGFTATARRLDPFDARRLELAETWKVIDRVVRERRLSTVWQPIISLSDSSTVGFEAFTWFPDDLVGWSPARYFTEAHAVGLGVDLELLAVRSAFADASYFPESTYISVNTTPGMITNGDFVSAFVRGPVSPDRVVLEMTEHIAIEDYESVTEATENLRSLGVRLAVDGAGAGYSSFRHIVRMRPDIIKIDQTISNGISRDHRQRAVTAAIKLYADQVGSTTLLAEGIETAEDLAVMSDLGIDTGQGFYWGPPAPASQLPLLKAHSA